MLGRLAPVSAFGMADVAPEFPFSRMRAVYPMTPLPSSGSETGGLHTGTEPSSVDINSLTRDASTEPRFLRLRALRCTGLQRPNELLNLLSLGIQA